MRLRIEHVTRYSFSRPVVHGLQRLRLTPKNTQGQKVSDWTMDFDGARVEVEYDDHHHNRTTLVSVNAGVTSVEVRCSGLVETADNHGIIGQISGYMPLWAFLIQTPLTRPGPRVRTIMADIEAPRGETLQTLHDLSGLVRRHVVYTVGATGVDTAGEEAAVLGKGVCQDHAHIFIGAARALGIPARYVSGYLMLNDRVEQEASHAWVEAYVDHLGWVGFDVSNGISPDERYVRVATGSDYREAAPVTGMSYGAGESLLEVQLAVEQQHVEQ
ncbi:transglutaminase-like putative cysteine protease [Novosphingobium kunmingense]|uniref:Transglutaminase-like putative cysteine protease n=1 Tax=Novosphingobium kunmingense TaxID=1211806 RepID=A0A2N0H671_9SPHN|nr:transglutaminase family protein [Novosphingobium kunmingense]PKB14417.1 transglutaminase-like putative cysteine protease [Novosphingobium kunmingense]